MSCTRKLLSVRNYSVLKFLNYSTGSGKQLGGKWSQLEQSQEAGYFQRKDRENLEYLKRELKDGKHIETISKKEIEQKKEEEKKKSVLEEWH